MRAKEELYPDGFGACVVRDRYVLITGGNTSDSRARKYSLHSARKYTWMLDALSSLELPPQLEGSDPFA